MKLLPISNQYPLRKTKNANNNAYSAIKPNEAAPYKAKVSGFDFSFCANFKYKMEAKKLQKQAQKYQALASKKAQEAYEGLSREQEIICSAKYHQRLAKPLGEGAFALLGSCAYRHFPYEETNLEKGIKLRKAKKFENGDILIYDKMFDGSRRIVHANQYLTKVLIRLPNSKTYDCYAFDPHSQELSYVFEDFRQKDSCIESKRRYIFTDGKLSSCDDVSLMFEYDDTDKALYTYVFNDGKMTDYAILNDSACEKYSKMGETFSFEDRKLAAYCADLNYEYNGEYYTSSSIRLDYDKYGNLEKARVRELADDDDKQDFFVSKIFAYNDDGLRCAMVGAKENRDEDFCTAKRAYLYKNNEAQKVLFDAKEVFPMLLSPKEIKL